MKDFRELDAGRQAHELNLWVHKLVRAYPGLVRQGLASQMQRAGTAIAAHIAEGCGSSGNPGSEKWHLHAALGSASSLDYLVFLASDLGLIHEARVEWFMAASAEVQTMLCVMLTDQETEDRAPASLTMVQ